MSCPIKVNSITIELTVHTSCYCVLDFLCVYGDRRANVQSMSCLVPAKPLVKTKENKAN